MGLFEALVHIIEEVVETTETAAEAAVTTAQAVVDDVTDAADAAAENTGKAVVAAITMVGMTLNAAARGAGIVAHEGQELLHQTTDRLGRVIGDPVGVVTRGIAAVGKGIGQFGENVGNQLKHGVGGWVNDKFEDVGIPLPDTYDLRSLLGFVVEVTGVVYDRLRERADRLFGSPTSGVASSGGGAQNPPFRSRLIKGDVRGEADGPSAQVAVQIILLLDRQSVVHGHHSSSQFKSSSVRKAIVLAPGHQLVRNLYADHLRQVSARSRTKQRFQTDRAASAATVERIVASGMELNRRILALNHRARAIIATVGSIVKRVNMRK